MRKLGVPYPVGYELEANKDLVNQEKTIKASLGDNKIQAANNKEILALIAYLQRLGKDIKAAPQQTAANSGTNIMGN